MHTIDLEIADNRKKLIMLAMRLFKLWNLDDVSQLNLLGLNLSNQSLLIKYRKGDQALSTRDVLDRIGWLLSIHKALRLLYPKNKKLRYSWINLRHQVLNNLTPLEVMKEQGLIGLAKIARYLDCLRGQ